MIPGLFDLTRLSSARTRSICAENPTGEKSGGARAAPGSDPSCTPAARELGRGWKVRPCLRNLRPGATAVLADIRGPGVVQHVWCTVLADVHRWLALRVFYDGQRVPAIQTPLGDFFANGLDGKALVNSLPIAVNPRGGMNSYWPMPFRERIRIELTNDGPRAIDEVFYQITYALDDVPSDAAYLHAHWRRSMTTRQRPEHVILDLAGPHVPGGSAPGGGRRRATPRAAPTRAGRAGTSDRAGSPGPGHYVGTSLVWHQLSNNWWGEGEVKFFIDGDPADAPTICGTGTEDYFGGAWGFIMNHAEDMRPTTFSTPFLGYHQAVYGSTPRRGPIVPGHALYRWHILDPVRFQRDLRVTVQALGWWLSGKEAKYQPLTDDIASVAYWYQSGPSPDLGPLPGLNERLPR